MAFELPASDLFTVCLYSEVHKWFDDDDDDGLLILSYLLSISSVPGTGIKAAVSWVAHLDCDGPRIIDASALVVFCSLSCFAMEQAIGLFQTEGGREQATQSWTRVLVGESLSVRHKSPLPKGRVLFFFLESPVID